MLCSLQSKVKGFGEVLCSWNIRSWSKSRLIWVRISVGEHCYIWYHNINWFPSKVVVGTCENCVLGTETCVNNVAFYQDLQCFQFPLSPFLKVHVNAGTKYPTDLATSFGCNICFAWSCNYKWDFCKKKVQVYLQTILTVEELTMAILWKSNISEKFRYWSWLLPLKLIK